MPPQPRGPQSWALGPQSAHMGFGVNVGFPPFGGTELGPLARSGEGTGAWGHLAQDPKRCPSERAPRPGCGTVCSDRGKKAGPTEPCCPLADKFQPDPAAAAGAAHGGHGDRLREVQRGARQAQGRGAECGRGPGCEAMLHLCRAASQNACCLRGAGSRRCPTVPHGETSLLEEPPWARRMSIRASVLEPGSHLRPPAARVWGRCPVAALPSLGGHRVISF